MANNKTTIKKRQYSNEGMLAAFNRAKTGELSIRGAARAYGIPEATLRAQINYQVPLECVNGHSSKLCKLQEDALIQHCGTMASLGYGYTRMQVIHCAKEMSGLELGEKWFRCFKQRHPEVKLIRPQPLEAKRLIAQEQSNLQNYFAELKKSLQSHNLQDHLQSIWNVDETGISTEHSPPKIMAVKGMRASCVVSPRSSLTTVIACGNALGQRLPPFIIFKGARVNEYMLNHTLPGTKVAVSKNGWSNSELFQQFLFENFAKMVRLPAVLLYDGHSTHVNAEVIRKARELQIHLFVLPPHSSHITQPLDVGIFAPLKRSLSAQMQIFMHQNPLQIITTKNLPEMIPKAYDSALSPTNLISAFRKTGVCTFDPQQVLGSLPTSSGAQTLVPNNREERVQLRKCNQVSKRREAFVEDAISSVSAKRRRSNIPICGGEITTPAFLELITNHVPEPAIAADAAGEPNHPNLLPQPQPQGHPQPLHVNSEQEWWFALFVGNVNPEQLGGVL